MRIKHSDVEVLRVNPKGFLKRPPSKGPPFGPHSVLRHSMLHFHKVGDDLPAATEYLRKMFKGPSGDRGGRFTEASLVEQLERLTAYADSYSHCLGRACHTAYRLNGITPGGNVVAGEVARIDTRVEASPGEPYYFAFLFEAQETSWKTDLRMPILQFAVAQDLKCPIHEVAVGVYCHQSAAHLWVRYDDPQVATAVAELDRLVRIAES